MFNKFIALSRGRRDDRPLPLFELPCSAMMRECSLLHVPLGWSNTTGNVSVRNVRSVYLLLSPDEVECGRWFVCSVLCLLHAD